MTSDEVRLRMIIRQNNQGTREQVERETEKRRLFAVQCVVCGDEGIGSCALWQAWKSMDARLTVCLAIANLQMMMTCVCAVTGEAQSVVW